MTERCKSPSDGHTWEIYKGRADKWRWRRIAKNGRIVGRSSQGYTSKQNCMTNARGEGMDCVPK